MSPYEDWQTLAWGASLLIAASVLGTTILAGDFSGTGANNYDSDRNRRISGSTAEATLCICIQRRLGPLAQETQIKIATRGLNFYYDDQQALFDNNLEIAANKVTAIIGPSGCGKSTHLRTYNRIFELYRGQRVSGEVLLDGQNILDSSCDVLELRRKVGMIFQKPTPFPMSVFDNIAYGLKQHYHINRSELRDRVEKASAAGRALG